MWLFLSAYYLNRDKYTTDIFAGSKSEFHGDMIIKNKNPEPFTRGTHERN